jgi:transcriptional regulator with XRE-family HTH domain
MPRRASDELGSAVVTVGSSLRTARKRLGLSVHALAERAGVSFGLVSELERGLGNPSLQSLQLLAAALGIPLGQLLDEPGGDLAVITAEHRHLIPGDPDEAPEQRVVRELLTPRGESMLQLIRSTLPPGFNNEQRPFRHIGTESVTVETGVLVVAQERRRVRVEAGDTVTYGCSTPHWWANGHDDVTIVLGAVTPFER